MKRKLLITLLLICGAYIGFAAITGLAGNWSGILKTHENADMPVTYTFKTDNDKLTGSVLYDSNLYNIVDGEIKGDSLSFDVDYNGNIVPHSGRFYPDSVGLNITLGPATYHIKLTHAAK